MAIKADAQQFAYVVRPGGLDAALTYWTEIMGAGPFFRGVFPLEHQLHKGKPTDQQAEVACGYHGEMQIEIIESLNDAAGPYNDFIARNSDIPVGGLYHHIMIGEGDYDATLARLLDNGCEEAFSARNPLGERMCYLDATATTGGYIELIDSVMWPPVCEAMRAARADWDGSDPVRSFESLMANLDGVHVPVAPQAG